MFTTHRKAAAAGGPITDGIVGWWKLDENTSNVAVDSSGSGNNGQLRNGASWSTIDGEIAVAFDGVDDRIRIGDVLKNVIEGEDKQFTITAEVNLDAVESEIIFAKVSDGNCSEYYRSFYAAVSGGRMRMVYYCGPEAQIVADYRFRTGATHILTTLTTYRIAWVYDGTTDANDGLDRLKYYVGGVEDTYDAGNKSGALTGIAAGQAQLTMSGFTKSDGFDCGTSAADGRIRDVRMYDRVLTPAEIAAIANGEG